jgi:hypothetical protein
VRVALLPHQVALVRLARGFGARVIDRKSMPCGGASGAANWAPAVEALREMLAHPNIGKGDATLVLSSHFTRYLVVPWSAQLISPAEELELARARFAQVYGQAALDWSIVMSPAPAGAGRVCAAVDQALVAEVGNAVAASALRLRSVQPALMALFNEWRRRIGGDAWLVLAERRRLVIAWIHAGQWRSVRARPLNGAAPSLAQLLEQERLLLSAPGGQKVFMTTLGEALVRTEGLEVEQLSPALPAAAPGAPEEDAIALAMCGA